MAQGLEKARTGGSGWVKGVVALVGTVAVVFGVRQFPAPSDQSRVVPLREEYFAEFAQRTAVKTQKFVFQVDGEMKAVDVAYEVPSSQAMPDYLEQSIRTNRMETIQHYAIVFVLGYFGIYATLVLGLWGWDKFAKPRSRSHASDNSRRLKDVLGIIGSIFVGLFAGTNFESDVNISRLRLQSQAQQLSIASLEQHLDQIERESMFRNSLDRVVSEIAEALGAEMSGIDAVQEGEPSASPLPQRSTLPENFGDKPGEGT